MNTKMLVASNKNHAKLSIFIVFLFVFFSFLIGRVIRTSPNCETSNKMYGYKFYLLFPFKSNILVPHDTQGPVCKYAFYEGVYKASRLVSTKSLNLMSVCDYINKSHPLKSWDQCFFMIGTAISFSERSKIDTPLALQKFIDKRIEYCESISPKTLDCVIGLYTGVNLAYQDIYNDSVFKYHGNDPFWLCKVGLGNAYKMQCYRNLVSYIYYYSNQDSNQAVALIESNLSDYFERYEVLLTYFSSLAYISTYSYEDIQKLCTSFEDQLVRYSCITGYATGIDEVAPNGMEGKEVVKYCLSPAYNYKEQGECIRRGFFELPTTNDIATKKQVCLELTPKRYFEFCNVEHYPLLPGYLRK